MIKRSYESRVTGYIEITIFVAVKDMAVTAVNINKPGLDISIGRIGVRVIKVKEIRRLRGFCYDKSLCFQS